MIGQERERTTIKRTERIEFFPNSRGRTDVAEYESPNRGSLLVRLLWWTLFAVAFGYVEASVVVYLRRLLNMAPGVDYPTALAARGVPFHSTAFSTMFQKEGLLHIEVGREIATLLLLLGASCAAGRNLRERLGLFGYSFAVWDLTYYLFLAVWIGFPHSLAATDIYFLVPIAWYGPVWFPVLVVMPAIILLSVRLLARAHFRTPIHAES